MKLAFICGPYRASTIDGIVQNIRRAETYAKKYWKLGYAVICPHKNTALFDGFCSDEVWLEGTKEILSRCDILVCIPGWQQSSGSQDEHALALKLNKEIIYE